MSVPLRIPVGNTPDWETKENSDEGPLNSVFESSALYHSLRQSRNAWLTTVFPKFTSKSKTKGQKEVVQPPHNLRFISKCDIEIGPHIFADTSVYEAHYMTEPTRYTPGMPSSYVPTTSYSQTTSGSYTYPLTSYNPYVAPVPAPPPIVPDKDPDVTPALIARVNEAAATNPTLHNLLQIAAAGEASMDQLRTLGFFIQQLAAVQQQAQTQAPPTTPFISTQPATSQPAFMQGTIISTSSRKHDLVLEFRENHTERFLIPREIVACEQEVSSSSPKFRKDIVLYTFVPFLNDENKFKAGTKTSSRTPAVIRLLNVSEAIWETIRGWVNEEAKRTDAWDSFFDKAEASGPRTYLQHRLPDGELLSQLKMLCENEYPMKPIKPTASSETTSKRVRSRKPATGATNEAKATTNLADAGAEATPPVGKEETASEKETAPKRRRVAPKATPGSTSGTPTGLHFINTIAPLPPPPPRSNPPAPVATTPVPTLVTDGPTQSSAGTS